jgi:outer membrane immunogenic protein
MKRYLVAGLLAGSWSSCVLAADLGPYGPPPRHDHYDRYDREYEPVREGALWQGLYVGVNGGYAWGDDSAVTFATPFGGGGTFGSLAADGWYGGGQVGYNAQFDRLVIGLEADLQGSDISASTSGFGSTGSVDINWFSTVRGRIGLTTGPALFYVTGGLAFAEVDYTVSGPPAVTLSQSSLKTGYTLGGGVEWAFDPNWSLKTEYLYVDLGDETLSGGGFSSSTSTEFQTVRVGLNYRF